MTEGDRKRVAGYLSRVRRGLQGLPPADVDDTVEEIRVHIFEEIGERGDVELVLADFGDPERVASDIVEKRISPEDGPRVPTASLGRRYSAWATDVVIGFGPLVLVPTLISFPFVVPEIGGGGFVTPIWLLLAAVVATRWAQPTGAAVIGFDPVVPTWQWILLVALIAWATCYWIVLRRNRSASVGMWMTGLRAVRVGDERVVVRDRDISQHPLPLGAQRHRWWILVGLIPTGCLCILLAVFYVWSGVGMFVMPPAETLSPALQEVRNREYLVCADFEAALRRGDEDAARALCDPALSPAIDEILERMAENRFVEYTLATDENGHGWLLDMDATQTPGRWDRADLTVGITTLAEGNTYTDTYLITAIAFGRNDGL